MNEGLLASWLGLSGIPREAELIPLERDLRIAGSPAASYHAAQISVPESAEAVKIARERGANVTCGHLDQQPDAERERHRRIPHLLQALPAAARRGRPAVAEGVIEYVVSGHVPQPAEDKRLPFSEAAFGSSGLEALLPGLLTLVQTEDLTLMQALRSVTSAPADLLGLWQGRLAIGAPADIILIHPDRPFVFDADSMLSRSKNSALDGRRLQGRAELTMVSGKIVHRAALETLETPTKRANQNYGRLSVMGCGQ
jgi:dihydroorotase